MQAAMNWKYPLYVQLHVHVSNYASDQYCYRYWKTTETTKDSQQSDNQICLNYYGKILFMEIY